MERIAMSQEERDKLEWLKRARDKGISQREAASKIGVSDRWVRKLLKRMKKQGDRVVVHALRGRASNRKITAKVQVRALEILPKHHAGSVVHLKVNASPDSRITTLLADFPNEICIRWE